MSDDMVILFEPMGRRVRTKKGATILQTALSAGIGIRTICGGRGLCGKCRIVVRNQSNLNEVTMAEMKHLSKNEIASGYRLACQSKIMDSITVFIPIESQTRERKIQIGGVEGVVELDPLVKKIKLTLPPPTLTDTKPDVERLLDSLAKKLGLENLEIDVELLKTLPDVLRDANWDITVTVWNNKRVIAIEPGDTTREIYGIAIDIGTSKIVAYLVDLTTGSVMSTSFIENPQTVHGEDVISRISYAMIRPKNMRELQSLAVEGVNSVISEVCERSRVSRGSVYEVTIVGNTAMHHLFLGIQPRYLALAPYTPAIKKSLDFKAKLLDIKTNPNANIHMLPIIAGFVGADNVADILSTGIHQTKEICLLLDIGTNTEVTLGNRDDLLSCSCASGPAFEGGHIKHGMKAVTGAIERVKIDPKNYDVKYKTIGGVKPIGICGSAMIDILAEMLKYHIIDQRGKFNEGLQTPRLRMAKEKPEFVIAWKEETTIGEDIVIQQEDVRELQLAKAAIYTGCSILTKRKSVRVGEISTIFIAGTFGNYINPTNAKLIGLIPDVETEKVRFVGNAAGSGARMVLISRKLRDKADLISERVQYLELAADPDFQTEFTSATYFPHKNMKRFPSLKNNL